LYRTVIRFMGPKSMLTIVLGVTSSVLLVVAFDRLVPPRQVPLSAFAIFCALALLYVLGSRFVVRYLLFHVRNGKPATRVASYGAGEAAARLCPVLLGGPAFAPVAFIDD